MAGRETVNIAWPRESIAPPGAPWYQIWAAPLLIGGVTVVGLAYLVTVRPHRGLVAALASDQRPVPVDRSAQ